MFKLISVLLLLCLFVVSTHATIRGGSAAINAVKTLEDRELQDEEDQSAFPSDLPSMMPSISPSVIPTSSPTDADEEPEEEEEPDEEEDEEEDEPEEEEAEPAAKDDKE